MLKKQMIKYVSNKKWWSTLKRQKKRKKKKKKSKSSTLYAFIMPKIPTHNKKHFTGLITDLDKILGSKGKTN